PRRELIEFRPGKTRLLLGRHLPGIDLVVNFFPGLPRPEDRGFVDERLEVQLRLSLLCIVAGDAMLDEDGLDVAAEAGRQGRRRVGMKGAKARPEQEKSSGEENRGDRRQASRAEPWHARPSPTEPS